ncbi:MAG TPA: fimbria/pilus outer membrane usher protein [Vicinamibacterales bacterium]|nr:fimbria/pilus outer membrane usher protein [Vicinamibacterales bacterium]
MRALSRRAWQRALLAAAALLSSTASAAAAGQRAILTVSLNEVDEGDALVVLRDGDALIAVTALERFGLHGFAGRRETANGETVVSLASLAPDVTFVVDERALTLTLTAKPSLFAPAVRSLADGRPPSLKYRRDPSGFLNYAVNARSDGSYDLFGETGMSVGAAFMGSTVSFASGGSAIRGMSSLTLDDPRRLRRIIAGDTFVSGGVLGGGLMVAGASVSREYALDPYFVRYPSFDLSGAVMTPSTAEIYVNGRLVRTQVLAPGPFDLTRLPVTSGPNDARVVIRDAFGGVRELTNSYYLTTTVLARGLQDYQYGAGLERRDFGTASWSYGGPAFVGRHRVGLTDDVTLGGRFEATSGLVSGGPTVAVRLPFGQMDAAAALSRSAAGSGAAAYAAYAYSGRRVSAGASVVTMSAVYETASLTAAQDRPKADVSEYVSVQLGPRASVTVQRRDLANQATGSGSRLSVLGSARLSARTDFIFSAATVSGVGAGREWLAGLNVRLAGQTSAAISAQQREGAAHLVAEIQQPLPVGRGWGYRFRGESGDGETSAADLEYQGSAGRYELRRDSVGGTSVTTLSASGSLVAVGGGLFASRAIQDGFALVRVPGVAGVRAYLSNQEVGRTNRNGDVLVPNLLPYYGNVLKIADDDVPLDHAVAAATQTVAPPDRGGAVVEFSVVKLQVVQARVRLVVNGAVVVPAYGQLRILDAGSPLTSPVGEAGEIYLENLPPGRHAAVLEHGGIACPFEIDMPARDVTTVNLGTLTCVVPER